jgi:hypothetical protein
MSWLISVADGTLMLYLLMKSPVDTRGPGSAQKAASIGMVFAFAMYWLISFASKGANIWNVVTQFIPNNQSGTCKTAGCKDTYHYIHLSLHIEQCLESAATGMLLLFSLDYALFAIGYIRQLPETDLLRKRLSWSISALAVAFVARNTVEFVITLYYSPLDHSALPPIQLLYLAIYGVLSVLMYISVVFVESTRNKRHHTAEHPRDRTLSVTGRHDEKQQVNLGVDQYSRNYVSRPYY